MVLNQTFAYKKYLFVYKIKFGLRPFYLFHFFIINLFIFIRRLILYSYSYNTYYYYFYS